MHHLIKEMLATINTLIIHANYHTHKYLSKSTQRSNFLFSTVSTSLKDLKDHHNFVKPK